MLVIATANRDKLREIEELLAGAGIDLAPLNRWPQYESPAETGATLEENAIIKAHGAARHTGLPAMADDTGLEVDALDGRPGIMAARFAGERATYGDNRRKLLGLLAGVPEAGRTAVFRTVAALCFPDGECHTVEGKCPGRITSAERGNGGFGYDPVFLVPALGLTFAEMDDATKNAVSHRGAALVRLRAVIADLARAGRL
ncbi:MAG: RdgB/HAM1 family non-canonical purine NTP pyrophosphatase [Candidatus Eisenbacteria bacterium]|nr:RdgB/HAM1 family non-canonical purine NTP pyrophosphatase [Candidatus Eisenbacteria bacterium]